MIVPVGICLMFRSKLRDFLEEMAFKDSIKDIPLIKHILELEEGCKLMELKQMVNNSQEKLFKITRVLLKSFLAIVFLVATLYLCTPIYEMLVHEDSRRLLGK